MEVSNTAEIFEDDLPPVPPAKPRTLTVLALLLTAAATFSYLGAYCVTDALAKANIIGPIHRASRDPRPEWAVISFTSMIASFVAVALVMKFWSGRHFRRIDRMLEADKDAEFGPALTPRPDDLRD